MAKNRMINTKIWSDSYFSSLDLKEKLLFLYFLTNQHTNICGIYEIPLGFVASESGIGTEDVTKVIKKFSKDSKIFYKKGWIFVKNFSKHQKSNPSVKLGIENELKSIPAFMHKLYNKQTECIQTVQSLDQSNSNPNLYSKRESNSNKEPEGKKREKWEEPFTAEREAMKKDV